jgi:CheY-like chemotaxis protein
VARTILVADDSPTIQKKASGILTGEGLEVVTVSNGVAAVKKLPGLKPLVVLADISMPGKDGYEVCEFVKKTDELRHIPVVLVFSDLEPYEPDRGARVNADGTIRKPFDHNELIATVQKFVAQSEAAAPRPASTPPQEPEPSYVTEPVDEEPVVEERPAAPDLSAFTGGVAFGAPMPSEEPAAAEPEPPAPVIFESADAPTEEIAAFEPLAPVEPPAEAHEVFSPSEGVEAPALEEPVPSEPMLVEEEAALSEPPPPTVEATMVFRAPADIVPPMLSEETAAAPVEAEAPPPPEPAPGMEATMRFRAPADIAPPVLTEETEALPAEAEAPPPPQEPPEPQEPAISASTLESYTLTEAAEGQVRFGAASQTPAPLEEAAAPAPEAEAQAAAAPALALDRERVYEIVHKVVAKMSPPAFPAEAIENMARRFSDEILNELGL